MNIELQAYDARVSKGLSFLVKVELSDVSIDSLEAALPEIIKAIGHKKVASLCKIPKPRKPAWRSV